MSIEVRIKAEYEEFVSATAQLKQFFGGVMQGMKDELKSMSDQAKTDMGTYESTTEQLANVVRDRFKGINGVVDGVRTAWAQLAVVVGAGAAIKNAIDETVKWTDESQALARALGISATQASVLKVAIQNTGGTTDEYLQISRGLTNQLATHESAMNKAGLATRDASGHLKDQQTMVLDALQTLRGYKEGTDRNIAAQQLFGQGVKLTSDVLQLNAESMAAARGEADALNLTVGKDGSEAVDEYKQNVAYLDGVMLGMKKTIADTLMPALNDLSGWFKSDGPTAVLAVKIAIDIVIALFRGLAFAAQSAVAVITAAFKNLLVSGAAVGEVMSLVFAGDFDGAKIAALRAFGEIQNNMGVAFDTIMAKAETTRDALSGMWDGIVDPKSAQDSGTEAPEGEKQATVKPDSGAAAAARGAAAEAKRLLKEQYDAQMESYRGEEQAAKGHFDQILEIQRKELAQAIAMYGEKSKQAEAVRNRIAETERQAAEQQRQFDEMRVESTRQSALARLDIERSHNEALQQAGVITMAQMLVAQSTFEDQRFQIELEAAQRDLQLNEGKVEQYQQTLDRIEELKRGHEANKASIEDQALIESKQRQAQWAQAMGGAIEQSVNGLITRTMSAKQAVGNIFAQMAQQFIAQESLKLGKAIVTQLAITSATGVGAATRTAIEASAARTSVLTTAGAAIKNIITKAAETFANIWASISTIPIVGPFIAPAIAIAGAGLVIGAVSRVASAEGGYDIPAGVNPLTQLHEREMVLPQRQADAVREMADGGSGGGGATFNIAVSAIDRRGIEKLFRENGDLMTQGLQRFHANR